MIMYMENTKESTKKYPLGKICEFNMITEYNINIHKSNASLYTTNEQLKMK